jgi:hypothetical protein
VDYLNFAVELTSLPDGTYRIAVESSPVGEASAIVKNPFTDQEVKDFLNVLASRGFGVTKDDERQAAVQFGQKLFNFLIRDNEDINTAYVTSLDRAGQKGLRLRLSVENAGPLAALPWEFLRDPRRDFLALSRVTPVVRYTQQLSIRPPVPITMPIRVLVMISSPSDFPTLDVEGEWNRLQEATADLQKKGLLLLERLDSATLIALQRRLRSQDYHIFHYIGHSDFDDYSGRGVLVLENDQDQTKSALINGDDLSRELSEEGPLRLVVLNSCQSAHRPDKDPFAGIASSLVLRGVPAVVGMQFPISDEAAKVFAEEFYRAISDNLPIDSAVSEARRAIANSVQNTEWATPVLYMRSEDGTLFRPVGDTAATPESANRRRLIVGVGMMLLAFLIIAGIYGIMTHSSLPATPTPTPTPSGVPNLVISTIRSAPARPAPGQIFRLIISISNDGTGDSGPFTYSWDASPTLFNAITERVENIPPGSSRNVTFPYSYGWWGSYDSVINLDVDGEVHESNERDNRQRVPIVTSDAPFNIDFSLLPDNSIVNPPLALTGTEFKFWGISFALNSRSRADCTTTTLNIIQSGDDLAITPATTTDCANLPLVLTLDKPVSKVQADVVALGDEQVTMTYFSDTTGTQQIFQTNPPLLVSAGQKVTLDPGDTQQRSIQRVEFSATGQPIILTRLVLFRLTQ